VQVLGGNVTHKEGASSVHLGGSALSLILANQLHVAMMNSLAYNSKLSLLTVTQKATVFANPVKHHN